MKNILLALMLAATAAMAFASRPREVPPKGLLECPPALFTES